MKALSLIVILTTLASCDTRKPATAERDTRSPCGRFQVVTGTAADFKTGRPVPTILRIDTETGETWYWNPPGNMGHGDWLPANDTPRPMPRSK